jgi:hypothetical protein
MKIGGGEYSIGQKGGEEYSNGEGYEIETIYFRSI